MRKILALCLLTFSACNKKDTTTPQRNYDGKWNILQSVSKEYTLNNGDTVFTKNETTTYDAGSAYIDFQLDTKGGGDVLLSVNNSMDSMTYEALSNAYFHLDSTLCEITSLSDSSFHFNTLIFENATIPDKIQVKQDFFVLAK
jgi:phage-related protein